MLSQCEFIQSIRSWKELGFTESYLLFGWKQSTAALITEDGAMTLLGRNLSFAPSKADGSKTLNGSW